MKTIARVHLAVGRGRRAGSRCSLSLFLSLAHNPSHPRMRARHPGRHRARSVTVWDDCLRALLRGGARRSCGVGYRLVLLLRAPAADVLVVA